MAGSQPCDPELAELVGELSSRSPEFRTMWEAHDVRFHRTGIKRMRHPVVGELELRYETLDFAADAGLHVSVFAPEPGSPSEDALRILASWAATPHHTTRAPCATRRVPTS